MSKELTGGFDVAAEFSLEAVNCVLAAQHQDGTYFHSIPTERHGEGLPWARIDDPGTGVRGLAQIEVSTPTVTLPPDESASRITIHFQLMAHMVAGHDSAAVPEFVHGQIQVTADVARYPSQFGLAGADTIEIDLTAEDLEVVFIPAPDLEAPLSDEETTRVNEIIRHVLMTGLDPVTSVVELPGRGEDLRVQQWWFKTMPDDQQPAQARRFPRMRREATE